MKKIFVAPSILSADFNNLHSEIKRVEKAGAEYLHFDVMDGHFVPNISFGLPVLKAISKTHKMVNDVHIMISEPEKYAKEFVKNGADILTFHLEACSSNEQVERIIKIIKENGCKAGLSIKPNTDVSALLPFIAKLDLILIMSVEPGFGGQAFISSALDKIAFLRDYIDTNNLNVLIEVDGGINEKTAAECKASGVDIVVAGSYLFGHDDLEERLESLR